MFVKTVEFDNYMKSLDPIESVQFLENAFVKYDNIIKNYDKIYKVLFFKYSFDLVNHNMMLIEF